MTRNSCFARAFTLIEMAVVLAVIAIMMAFVYPAYVGMSQRAKATKDLSNLRQIGMLIQLYLNDNDQILPATTTDRSMSYSVTGTQKVCHSVQAARLAHLKIPRPIGIRHNRKTGFQHDRFS